MTNFLQPIPDPALQRVVEQFSASLKDTRIIIHGESGAGKTTLMFAILQRANLFPSIYIDRCSGAAAHAGVPGATIMPESDKRLLLRPNIGRIAACSLHELLVSERNHSQPQLESLLADYWRAGAGGIVTVPGSIDPDSAIKTFNRCYPKLAALATRHLSVSVDRATQRRRYDVTPLHNIKVHRA